MPRVLDFSDFSRAFDCLHGVTHPVTHQQLLKLYHYGVRDSILLWINNFHTKRSQRVIVDGEAFNWAPVTPNVPHCARPIVISKLHQRLVIWYNIKNIDYRLSADDSWLKHGRIFRRLATKLGHPPSLVNYSEYEVLIMSYHPHYPYA